MVMFILATLGAVFVALVARNLFRSARFSDVDVVAQLAEAGTRYADQMLTTSEDGADWRPVPDNHAAHLEGGGAWVPDTDWEAKRDAYPDFQWTRTYSDQEQGWAGPSGGYTTFNSGQGRFLLRVSYNPRPDDPKSKFIKIESIGRIGVFLEDDPTTHKPNGNYQMRREITAYKPIGITDYVRFVTNKNNRDLDFALGCPGHPLELGRIGANAARKSWYRGGPLRVNGNLVFHGDTTDIYLRGTHPLLESGNPDHSTFVPIEGVEVSGSISFSESAGPARMWRLNPDGTTADPDYNQLLPSSDPGFRTWEGFYRDGSDSTDSIGNARGVKRLDPPQIDQYDATNSVSRYLLLTLYSGERIADPAGKGYINLGEWGWGRGIYINNRADKQDDSETLFGGFTLRTDWLRPGYFMGNKLSGWVGPAYIPPGVLIVLHPDDTDGDDQPDMTITRSDTVAGGRRFVWRDAWGNPRPALGGTITMPYPHPSLGREAFPMNERGNYITNGTPRMLDGNGVIYAEGNVRIRGMLPEGMQLTVVSNETIYIEGNLLKARSGNYDTNALHPWRGADPTCGLALLARENICVNTTQFFSPLNSISSENIGSDADTGGAPYHVLIGSSPDSRYRCAFDFGPWESNVGNPPQNAWWMYLRHAGQYGPTYINAWLNPSQGVPNFGLLNLNLNPLGGIFTADLPPHVLGVGDARFNAPGFGASGWGIDGMFLGCAFPLDAPHNAVLGTNFFTYPGMIDELIIGLDQNSYTRNNYQIAGVAVQPMDVRIEAICYAQEGSFFVIPGTWFNANPADTQAAFLKDGGRPAGVHPKFPFYGQPLDVRIIIDGAVSENIPAPVGDVQEWMAKWGLIPEDYGSTHESTAHPGEGFTILYDDHVGWPLTDLSLTTVSLEPIRKDRFGRTLPIAPRLPVCGGLIYFGDVM